MMGGGRVKLLIGIRKVALILNEWNEQKYNTLELEEEVGD